MTTVDPWAATTSTPVHTVQADMDRIRGDHYAEEGRREKAHWDAHGYTSHLGNAPKQSYRAGWWAGVAWVLNTQHAIDNLTQGELLTELRKAEGSIYWPLLSADPTIPAECPRCDRRVVIDREGLCPECAYEFPEID